MRAFILNQVKTNALTFAALERGEVIGLGRHPEDDSAYLQTSGTVGMAPPVGS